ncbi:TMEM175 family protein [Agromyces ramosus]|uniref:Membrane protein n=1 Tax=Agromyces ramosus TaxID=33879 RepID=A0ABU0R5N1_9MICO|nr:TMEM175 family protein [Agromyces ramosus]MDQ0893032.1 putative membrane protein [Agromyces ramosus]
MTTATGLDRRYERDTVEFARAVAFFDAVYAIALTLLVVNIDPPAAADWASLGAFLSSGVGWQLLGFAISFVVIAVFWRVNHRIIAGFSALTPATIIANLVAIAFVVLIPFSTQGISDVETSDEPLAVAVYAIDISLAVLAQSAMYAVARRDGVLRHPLPRRADAVRFIDTLTTPLVFLASIPIAYAFGADWGRYTWATLLVIGPLSGRWADRRVARIRAEAAAADTTSEAA